MDKKTKKDVKRLIKERKFDEIFEKYGGTCYRNYVPTWYSYEEIKKLKKEKRYEDIYIKYGYNEYRKILEKARYDEIKEYKGKTKAYFYKTKCILKHIGVNTALVFTGFAVFSAGTTEEIIKMNSIQYADEIEEYDKKIKNYAEKIRKMNLTKLQTLMKVTEDMWDNIEGYKTPSKDVFGFFELDLATQDGYGVCRNFAADVAKKLNAINPEFNARTINVYIAGENIKKANINENKKQKVAKKIQKENEETETEKPDQNEVEENKNNTQEFWDKIYEDITDNVIGNHMVTLVDIPEDKITLVLDPTNPSISIYQNGKIILLNPGNITMDAKEYSTAIYNGGIDGLIDSSKGFLDSFKKPKLSYEEIVAKYGLEAQNNALKQIKAITTSKNDINPERAKFIERIRVNKLEKDIKNENYLEINEDRER